MASERAPLTSPNFQIMPEVALPWSSNSCKKTHWKTRCALPYFQRRLWPHHFWRILTLSRQAWTPCRGWHRWLFEALEKELPYCPERKYSRFCLLGSCGIQGVSQRHQGQIWPSKTATCTSSSACTAMPRRVYLAFTGSRTGGKPINHGKCPMENGGYPGLELGKSTINMGLISIYPLVNCYITNWKDPPFLIGKLNYFDWAIFNSKLLVYQRVNLQFPMVFLWFSH